MTFKKVWKSSGVTILLQKMIVWMSYLEEQTESHPLVILDMLLVPFIPGLVHPRMRHVNTDPLPMRRAKRVCGMDPTVCVQNILGDVPGVNTHDWRSNVLSCSHYEGEGQEGHDGDPVVEAEHGAVRVVTAHLHQAFQSQEKMQHFEAVVWNKLFTQKRDGGCGKTPGLVLYVTISLNVSQYQGLNLLCWFPGTML